MRKISFKLRVIRLNRVESFYVLLLRFYSECSEEGQPGQARSPSGIAGACRGDACGHRQHPQGRHPWRCPLRDGASPQGRSMAQRPQELPLERQRHLSAHKGSTAYRKGGRPWARRPLDEGRRGELGFPFGKRTILPL
ncbi:hypothetical protein B296_00022595 [Ensete ventricosum]|uniref:Uncharacterized protein n=1 Tax=Ensete ventricosum TaxID=4639 RepID=A0A426Y0W7_ENSVE|nr:hypothetical protein B296_00022595 [Ensete ventricosum]